MSQVLFNNYFFTLLKKLKDVARAKKKDKSNAALIEAIKAHYASYDTSSEDYVTTYCDISADVMKSWNDSVTNVEEAFKWLEASCAGDGGERVSEGGDGKSEVESERQRLLYRDISVSLARDVCKDDALLLYFIATLNVIAEKRGELSEANMTSFNDVVQRTKTPEEAFPDNEYIRSKLTLMNDLRVAGSKSDDAKTSDAMKDIENTSLGRLAKEIMADIDVDQLKSTLDADGDILKTLGNPDSGITKLLGTVSQKLIAKMATGELNNETLLRDAMQFTSKMGAFSGGGGMPSAQGMPDMSAMMNMFQGMMGSGNDEPPRAPPAPSRTSRVDDSAMSRVAKAKQLKRKLNAKRAKSQGDVINANDMVTKKENV